MWKDLVILCVLFSAVTGDEAKSNNETLQAFLGKLAEAWDAYGGLDGPEVKKAIGTAYQGGYDHGVYSAYDQNGYGQGGYGNGGYGSQGFGQGGNGPQGINPEYYGYGGYDQNGNAGYGQNNYGNGGSGQVNNGYYGSGQGLYGGYEQNYGLYGQGQGSYGQGQYPSSEYGYGQFYGQGGYGQYYGQGGYGQRPYGQSGYGQGVYPGYRPPYRPRPVPPALPPGYRPPQATGFMAALDSITRNDDLRCVPRLLCELAAAGKVDRNQRQTSFLPFAGKDSLIKLLTVAGLVEEGARIGPALILGRAALLGYTTRGDTRPCLTAYPTCPTDPDRLVHYLNNHNGGFFAYFSGQPQLGYSAGGYRAQASKNELEERIQTRPDAVSSYHEDEKPSSFFGQPELSERPTFFSQSSINNHVGRPGKLLFSSHRGGKTLAFPHESKAPVSGYDRLPSHLEPYSPYQPGNLYQTGNGYYQPYRRGRQVRFPQNQAMVFPSFRNKDDSSAETVKEVS